VYLLRCVVTVIRSLEHTVLHLYIARAVSSVCCTLSVHCVIKVDACQPERCRTALLFIWYPASGPFLVYAIFIVCFSLHSMMWLLNAYYWYECHFWFLFRWLSSLESLPLGIGLTRTEHFGVSGQFLQAKCLPAAQQPVSEAPKDHLLEPGKVSQWTSSFLYLPPSSWGNGLHTIYVGCPAPVP